MIEPGTFCMQYRNDDDHDANQMLYHWASPRGCQMSDRKQFFVITLFPLKWHHFSSQAKLISMGSLSTGSFSRVSNLPSDSSSNVEEGMKTNHNKAILLRWRCTKSISLPQIGRMLVMLWSDWEQFYIGDINTSLEKDSTFYLRYCKPATECWTSVQMETSFNFERILCLQDEVWLSSVLFKTKENRKVRSQTNTADENSIYRPLHLSFSNKEKNPR